MTTDTPVMNPQKKPFTPSDHLIPIKTNHGDRDYLPVAARLVWFREQCPEGVIETEMLHLDLDRDTEAEVTVWSPERRRNEKVTKHAKGFVIFRAVVRDGKGGIASGTKSEKAAAFEDFIEKAESGAIGRALGALGYGTQFAGDDWDESHRIVDSPVDRQGKSKKQGERSGKNSKQVNPPLDEQIKQAKLRAQKIGLAQDADEWASLLKACQVTIINSAVELAKITGYMDQFEREQETSQTLPETQAQEKTDNQMDTPVRDKLNDLYTRAKKLKLCANDRQFVSYVRRVVNDSRLDIKSVTLETLAKVEDDIVIKEKAEVLEQSNVKEAVPA